MRLVLEAEPGEISGKRDKLMRALIKSVQGEDPDLADKLHRVMEPPHVQPEHKALQQMQQRLRIGYAKEMRRAVARIGKVLDETL